MPRPALLCLLALIVAGLAAAAMAFTPFGHRVVVKLRGAKTVEDRLAEFGDAARARWRPHFEAAGVAYPPRDVTLYAIKGDRILHVYVDKQLIRSLPVLGQSGGPGPKLREGDRQVPEGVYGIESLHPNSRFHAALRVAYPNEHDRALAASEGRSFESLGGDIMIHGGSASVGCLAMGDAAAEDLFALAADVGVESVTLLVAPIDLRIEAIAAPADAHAAGKLDRVRQRLLDLR